LAVLSATLFSSSTPRPLFCLGILHSTNVTTHLASTILPSPPLLIVPTKQRSVYELIRAFSSATTLVTLMAFSILVARLLPFNVGGAVDALTKRKWLINMSVLAKLNAVAVK